MLSDGTHRRERCRRRAGTRDLGRHDQARFRPSELRERVAAPAEVQRPEEKPARLGIGIRKGAQDARGRIVEAEVVSAVNHHQPTVGDTFEHQGRVRRIVDHHVLVAGEHQKGHRNAREEPPAEDGHRAGDRDHGPDSRIAEARVEGRQCRRHPTQRETHHPDALGVDGAVERSLVLVPAENLVDHEGQVGWLMHHVADRLPVRGPTLRQWVIGRSHHVTAAREPFCEVSPPLSGGVVTVAVQHERMGPRDAAREPHRGDERPPLLGIRAVTRVIRARCIDEGVVAAPDFEPPGGETLGTHRPRRWFERRDGRAGANQDKDPDPAPHAPDQGQHGPIYGALRSPSHGLVPNRSGSGVGPKIPVRGRQPTAPSRHTSGKRRTRIANASCISARARLAPRQ